MTMLVKGCLRLHRQERTIGGNPAVSGSICDDRDVEKGSSPQSTTPRPSL